MKIVLASASPRRREILSELGLDIEILPARRDEMVRPGAAPEEAVTALAYGKAAEVSAIRPEALVIGADTLVAMDGELLGKPRERLEAGRMLRALSGREHQVYTGLCLMENGQGETRVEESVVRFRELSDQDIEAYIATGEPMDKAGAYGIQGLGRLLVRGIEGDYYNVVGLPVGLLVDMLSQRGIDIWDLRQKR